MRNILVTGSTGFVGHYLVELLIKQTPDTIYCFTRNLITSNDPRVIIINGDLTEKIQLNVKIDIIFNCAGVIQDVKNMEAVNVGGVRNLIEIALKHNAILIHLSSAGIYGPVFNKIIHEEDICLPISLYEKTKLEAEKLIFSAIKFRGLRSSILRPTTVIGIGRSSEKDSFLHLCKSIKCGRYRNINKGKGIYGIVHANEVSRALLHLANNGFHNGDAYNLNSIITFKEFSELISNKFNWSKPKSLSISFAYIISIILYIISSLLRKKNILSFSRIRALTNQTIYVSEKIREDLNFKADKTIEFYIIDTISSYISLKLL